MPAKIRLQRFGKKRHAYFHLVIADSRAPRDGKFIERIGSYDPNTNPATIEIEFDKALDWLKKGAQPTDTAKAILSYKGVMYKNHLDKGVTKGAFSQEEAETKFEEWKNAKEEKLAAKKGTLSSSKEEALKKRLKAEKEVNEKRAQELAAKNSPLADEVAKEENAEESSSAEASSVDAEAQVDEKNKEEATKAAETQASEETAKEEAVKAPETQASEKPAKEEATKAAETQASEEAAKEEKKD